MRVSSQTIALYAGFECLAIPQDGRLPLVGDAKTYEFLRPYAAYLNSGAKRQAGSREKRIGTLFNPSFPRRIFFKRAPGLSRDFEIGPEYECLHSARSYVKNRDMRPAIRYFPITLEPR